MTEIRRSALISGRPRLQPNNEVPILSTTEFRGAVNWTRVLFARHLAFNTTLIFVAFACFLFSFAGSRGVTAAPRLPAPDQGTTAESPVGLKTTDLVELANRTNAGCVLQEPTLLRCSGRLRIDGLSKTLVLGRGVRIEFTDSAPGKGGILLLNAHDVELSEFEIGWLAGGARDPSVPGVQRLQSFGDVSACPNGSSGGILSLEMPLDGLQPLGAISIWDDRAGWPWYSSSPDSTEFYFQQNAVTSFSAGKSNCLPQLSKLVGRHVLMRHVMNATHAFQCLRCSNVKIEKVKVTSAPGMAFVFGEGSTNLILRNNIVAPKCSPHCERPEPSVAQDASHFAGDRGDIVLENNDFGWQGDDAVNITGLLIPAQAEPGTDVSGRFLIVDDKWRSRLWQLTAGSKALMFDRGLSALGEAEVLAVDPASGRIKASQLPANAIDFIIVGKDAVPRQVIIRNNHFHDNRARGILIGASDALIEGNVIERVTMEAILVPADTGPWYEGPGAQNVTIRGNRISSVNRHPDRRGNYPSAISAGISVNAENITKVGTPIRHIRVDGNRFDHVYSNGDVPVSFGKGVTDAEVHN